MDRVDDPTKINYSIVEPMRKDYESFNEYWAESSNYLYVKYKDTYAIKKKSLCSQILKKLNLYLKGK